MGIIGKLTPLDTSISTDEGLDPIYTNSKPKSKSKFDFSKLTNEELDLTQESINRPKDVLYSGVRRKDFEDYVFGAIDPINKDIFEERAQTQSNAVKLSMFIPRVANKVLAETLKIPGELYGVGEWAATGFDYKKFEESINNAWVNSIQETSDKVNEELFSVYKRKSVEEGGLMRQIVSPEFWATEGADGVGFLLSMMTPGIALKSFKVGANMAKLLKISKPAQAMKFAGAVDDIAAAGINTIVEATAEGLEASKSLKDELYKNKYTELLSQGMSQQTAMELSNKYIESDEAKLKIGKAGANNTTANIAILFIPNLIDQKWLFKSTGRAMKKGEDLVNTKLSQALGTNIEDASKFLGNVTKYTTKDLVKAAAKELPLGVIKEGFFEEGMQFSTSEYFKARELGKETRGVVEGVLGTYLESFGNIDFQKSVFLGAVLGGGMATIGGVREKKQEDRLLFGDQKTGKKGLVNLLKDNFVSRYQTLNDIAQKNADGTIKVDPKTGEPIPDLTKATRWAEDILNSQSNKEMMQVFSALGITEGYEFAKLVQDFNYMIPFFQQEGGREILNRHIDKLAEEDAKYMKEVLKITPRETNEIAADLKRKADIYEKIYYDTILTHKFPKNIPIEKGKEKELEEFNKHLLDSKISNELKQAFVIETKKKLSNEISSLESKEDLTSQEKVKLPILKDKLAKFEQDLNELQQTAKDLNNSSKVKEELTRREKAVEDAAKLQTEEFNAKINEEFKNLVDTSDDIETILKASKQEGLTDESKKLATDKVKAIRKKEAEKVAPVEPEAKVIPKKESIKSTTKEVKKSRSTKVLNTDRVTPPTEELLGTKEELLDLSVTPEGLTPKQDVPVTKAPPKVEPEVTETKPIIPEESPSSIKNVETTFNAQFSIVKGIDKPIFDFINGELTPQFHTSDMKRVNGVDEPIEIDYSILNDPDLRSTGDNPSEFTVELEENQTWWLDEGKAKFKGIEWTQVPMYISYKGVKVGKIAAKETGRKDIYEALKAGKEVILQLNKKDSWEFINMVDSFGRHVFISLEESLGNNPILAILRGNKDFYETEPYFDFGVHNTPKDLLKVAADTVKSPGAFGHVWAAVKNPVGNWQMAKLSTKNLGSVAIEKVKELLINDKIYDVLHIVSGNSPYSDANQKTYLQISQTDGKLDTLKYFSPTIGKSIAIDAIELQKALKNKPFKYQTVSPIENDKTNRTELEYSDKTSWSPSEYINTFTEDFTKFLKGKKYEISVEFLNSDKVYSSRVTEKEYPSYLQYLMSAEEGAEIMPNTEANPESNKGLVSSDIFNYKGSNYHNVVLNLKVKVDNEVGSTNEGKVVEDIKVEEPKKNTLNLNNDFKDYTKPSDYKEYLEAVEKYGAEDILPEELFNTLEPALQQQIIKDIKNKCA